MERKKEDYRNDQTTLKKMAMLVCMQVYVNEKFHSGLLFYTFTVGDHKLWDYAAHFQKDVLSCPLTDTSYLSVAV